MLACLLMTGVLAASPSSTSVAWEEGRPTGAEAEAVEEAEEAEPPPGPLYSRAELDWRLRRQRLNWGLGLSITAFVAGTGMLFGSFLFPTSCSGDVCSTGGGGLMIAGASVMGVSGLTTVAMIPVSVRHNKRKPPEMAFGPGRFALRF